MQQSDASAKSIIIWGRNSTTPVTAATLWEQGGLLAPPTDARIHNIVSASAADAAAGTGIRTLKISGVDADWKEAEETVTLNGTTPVATTKSYRFINKMEAVTVGSGLDAAGNITATAATDSSVSAQIPTDEVTSVQAAYAVPAGYTAFLKCFHASSAKNTNTGQNGRMHLVWKRIGDAVFSTITAFWSHSNGSSYARHDFDPALVIPEKTILRLDAQKGQVATTEIAGGFELVLRAN